jgi:hypothetical protein
MPDRADQAIAAVLAYDCDHRHAGSKAASPKTTSRLPWSKVLVNPPAGH